MQQQKKQQQQQQQKQTQEQQQQQQQEQQQQEQQMQQYQQQRGWRIQQLLNYRPRKARKLPPMVPSPSFAAAVALACLAGLCLTGGAACLAKQCNGSVDIGATLLGLSGASLAVSVALFASLPCCYCDKSYNCHVRDSCTERCSRIREECCCGLVVRRRQRRIASLGGLPSITVNDYSSKNSAATELGGGSSRRMSTGSISPQLAWCYDGAPADSARLHPMYGRRDSTSSIGSMRNHKPDWEAPPVVRPV